MWTIRPKLRHAIWTQFIRLQAEGARRAVFKNRFSRFWLMITLGFYYLVLIRINWGKKYHPFYKTLGGR